MTADANHGCRRELECDARMLACRHKEEFGHRIKAASSSGFLQIKASLFLGL